MVYRFQLTYDKTIEILNLKYIPTKGIGFSIPPTTYEIIDNSGMLKHSPPKEVKVDITIDDIRLETNIKINQTLIFTEKFFNTTILGFTQSRFYPLDDVDGFYQSIAELYNSDKPFIITVIDEIHIKRDCIFGSIVNGTREPILYSFPHSSPRG